MRQRRDFTFIQKCTHVHEILLHVKIKPLLLLLLGNSDNRVHFPRLSVISYCTRSLRKPEKMKIEKYKHPKRGSFCL